jgi:hypothetical protein
MQPWSVVFCFLCQLDVATYEVPCSSILSLAISFNACVHDQTICHMEQGSLTLFPLNMVHQDCHKSHFGLPTIAFSLMTKLIHGCISYVLDAIATNFVHAGQIFLQPTKTFVYCILIPHKRCPLRLVGYLSMSDKSFGWSVLLLLLNFVWWWLNLTLC